MIFRRKGFHVDDVKAHIEEKSESGEKRPIYDFRPAQVTHSDEGVKALFIKDVDIIIAAAGPEALTDKNVHRLRNSKVRLIVEGGNGPMTAYAEKMIAKY